MARPVRIRVSGGMYHVFTRGHNREALFCHAADAEHFLELLQEMRERFRMRLFAYGLMPNHYHVLVGTPVGNISQGIQWLNGSYGIWFNRRHNRSGHVFGERFKAILIENGSWLLEASVYVHLNCVVTEGLGWSKRDRVAQRQGVARPPTTAEVDRRLTTLREFRWSSYRGYAGYEPLAAWLDRETLLQRLDPVVEKAKVAYRTLVENRIRQGVEESLGVRTKWGLILGSERFARRVREHVKVGRESRGRRAFQRRLDFEAIVRIVEQIKQERWDGFRERHGDSGRDLVLWAGRRFGGLTLKELGAKAGGMDYSTVAVAVLRLTAQAQRNRTLRALMQKVARKCQM